LEFCRCNCKPRINNLNFLEVTKCDKKLKVFLSPIFSFFSLSVFQIVKSLCWYDERAISVASSQNELYINFS
jgi:hypothetical protein